VYLLATGTTLADAQDAGWVLKPKVRGFGCGFVVQWTALTARRAAFHVYLLATGMTLADAQDAGWVLKPEVRGLRV
jgi:hypothetical protein